MIFVIFHGAFGNPQSNWFPELKEKLFALDQEVVSPQFPVEKWKDVEEIGPSFIPKNQTLTNWLKVFKLEVLPKLKKSDKLCFIGHSLAPVFILHIIDKFNLQLDSAIFVQPFMRRLKQKEAWPFDVVNATFYKTDFNFNKLRNLIHYSYVIYSNNDQFVKPELPLEFAEKLKSSTILIKGAKHINAPQFVQFPLVLELCKSRLDPSVYLK